MVNVRSGKHIGAGDADASWRNPVEIGKELLQYIDEQGNFQDVTSTHVNEDLKAITGKNITAKDFRTWAGTVLAAMTLSELQSFDSAAQDKRSLRSAIEKVSTARQHIHDLQEVLHSSGGT